eukprot:6466381-Amphidinium_carterae.1
MADGSNHHLDHMPRVAGPAAQPVQAVGTPVQPRAVHKGASTALCDSSATVTTVESTVQKKPRESTAQELWM